MLKTTIYSDRSRRRGTVCVIVWLWGYIITQRHSSKWLSELITSTFTLKTRLLLMTTEGVHHLVVTGSDPNQDHQETSPLVLKVRPPENKPSVHHPDGGSEMWLSLRGMSTWTLMPENVCMSKLWLTPQSSVDLGSGSIRRSSGLNLFWIIQIWWLFGNSEDWGPETD